MIDDPQVVRELHFQPQVYSLVVLKKAAYRLSDRCFFEFEVSENETLCRLKFPERASPESIVATIQDFHREALDQDLRHTISEETSSIRNLILSHAFSRTGLQGK